MLTIRLTRTGKRNHAMFRVVVIDHKKATNARSVEILGHYDPHAEKDGFVVDKERAEYWLKNGAQTSTTVASQLKKIGVDEKLIQVLNKKTQKPKPVEESEESDAPAAPAAEEKPAEEAVEKKTEEAPKEEKKEEKAEEKKEEKSDDKKEEKPEEAKDEEKK